MDTLEKMDAITTELKRLLDRACINYIVCAGYVKISNMPGTNLVIYPDGIRIVGCGYSGIWLYSPEYVARMLDRKFAAGEGI